MNNYTSLINSAPLVMVEFFATWCPHCQAMMPVIAQIRELVGSNAEIYQLDVDRNQEASEANGVEATPTFIIYRNGEPVWRFAGEIDGNVLLQKLESFMN
ncbi:MAG: thioredoxin family protein [Muribaculaceae bacterium]|nr:thioredoxin family protein [Muribaculaceae bacterium]